VRGLDWLERHVLGLRYRVLGELPRHGPALIAMQHQSAWETLKLHMLFDDPCIAVKQELLRLPLWGGYLAALRMMPVDRAAGQRALPAMLDAARAAVVEGRCLVIFPEGTRVPHGERHPLKGGITRIYEATGLPIIPVTLDSGLFWPKNVLRRRPGTVTLRVLDPIPPNLDAKQVLRILESRFGNNGANTGRSYDTR
jgi:1-acyl-sn-glycerol-3-phosphate acyltransferase